MGRRISLIAALYLFITGLLVIRIFLISVFPNRFVGGAGAGGVLEDVHMRLDLEHFKVQSMEDGRGRILYRDGKRFRESTSQLVGWVGLPDEWPQRSKMAAEQGRNGLEDTFDSWLEGRPGFVGVLSDATGTPVSSIRYRVPTHPGVDIRTTVDARWQSRAGEALHRARIRTGAVVILDAKRHEILALSGALAGHPAYVPAVTPATPGSIFKLVTAAAALESYELKSTQPFFCDGRSHISGVRMRCWRIHGRLSLQEAIAQSCDSTFAQVSQIVGAKAIQIVADAMGCTNAGIQRVDGKRVLKAAMAGRVFTPTRPGSWSPGQIANTAIGQEDVSISPLVGANLAATVADGGSYEDAQLVLDAQREGKVMRRFSSSPHRVLRADVAGELASAMRQAVTSPSGTAHALANAPVPVAVKTGTAELGTGSNVNAWMIGFAPYPHPTIAFAVYVGNAPSKLAHRQVIAVTRSILSGLS